MTNPTSVLRKVLVDPGTGHIDGLGRTRRRPNQALRDLIAARDRECGHCTRPAPYTDLDHIKEWVKDRGPTDPDNLTAKCEKLHYLKDHPHWDVNDTNPDTGELSITTPAKRTYKRKRHPILDLEPQRIPQQPLPDKPPF